MTPRSPLSKKRSWRSAGLLAVAALALAGVAAAQIGLGMGAHVARSAPAPRGPLFDAFYVGWDDNARTSLASHVGALDVFSPMWVTVRGAKAELVPEDDPQTQALIAARPHPPRVIPIVSNAHDDIWDAKAAGAAILDPAVRASTFTGLAALARARGFSGFVFDFEQLTPPSVAGFPAFLSAARAALGPQGLKVWAVVSVDPQWSMPALAASADAVVLMGYDECWASSNPGPVAGADWLQAVLAQRLAGVDPGKVVVALASYGYDWPRGGRARVISVADAIALARRTGAAIRRDPVSGDATFAYVDPKGVHRDVWMVDGPAFALQRRLASAFRPQGIALWRLGLEDPGLWSQPASGGLKPPPAPAPGAPVPNPCDPLPTR